MRSFKGFLMGLLSGASFGLIPLFSKPLLDTGFSVETVLTFRHLLAALLIGSIFIVQNGFKFKINLKEFASLLICGLAYYFSAALLLGGYKYMTTGLATTLHFLYPVFVTLIMGIFFRQKISPFTIIAIFLALAGVSMLCLIGKSPDPNLPSETPIWSIILVMLSGLAYAVYIVIVNNIACLRVMNNFKLTFYTMLFCGIIFLVKAEFLGSLTFITGKTNWIYLLLFAIVPTLVSNIALVKAIKVIGSTLTSVLGAMEPLTAIIVGIILFGEKFTIAIAGGIILILLAVIIIISSPLLDKNISGRLKRFKARMRQEKNPIMYE